MKCASFCIVLCDLTFSLQVSDTVPFVQIVIQRTTGLFSLFHIIEAFYPPEHLVIPPFPFVWLIVSAVSLE